MNAMFIQVQRADLVPDGVVGSCSLSVMGYPFHPNPSHRLGSPPRTSPSSQTLPLHSRSGREGPWRDKELDAH